MSPFMIIYSQSAYNSSFSGGGGNSLSVSSLVEGFGGETRMPNSQKVKFYVGICFLDDLNMCLFLCLIPYFRSTRKVSLRELENLGNPRPSITASHIVTEQL